MSNPGWRESEERFRLFPRFAAVVRAVEHFWFSIVTLPPAGERDG